MKVWKGEASYARWLLHPPLYCLSRLYGLGLRIREYLFKKGVAKIDEVSIPVVSVGNITVGGTGKTPVVEKLALALKGMGFNPGIVTRGYKRIRKGTFCVDRDRDTAEDVGDEALMLAKRTKVPVIVGARRSQAIVEGMRKCDIDLALLDDGFQVKNTKKHVDIVVVSGGGRGGTYDLFPLGPCREPVARVRDADAVLVNKGYLDPGMARLVDGIPTFKVQYKPAYLYNVKHNVMTHFNFLKKRKILAFSGLGDNESFFELLRSLGAHIVREIPFPDHHRYTPKDIEGLASCKDVKVLITTEKDAVKITGMDVPDGLFYLSIEATIEKEQELLALIRRKLEASEVTLPALGSGERARKHWAN
ncbi:tetraacyldisaccharide 4'-kinase [Syntrophorhabdus aromaticivorans]|uniref:tetraacyldisaccharide 4'-kinase n=1 Tax=Syntrophorhabdus aromaticivorans TaxID=328301 RepID=UPI000402A1F3|nr:tetraacyldisaccharide 4'-kinase [Syntrophorhabdus aromaticivorans]